MEEETGLDGPGKEKVIGRPIVISVPRGREERHGIQMSAVREKIQYFKFA